MPRLRTVNKRAKRRLPAYRARFCRRTMKPGVGRWAGVYRVMAGQLRTFDMVPQMPIVVRMTTPISELPELDYSRIEAAMTAHVMAHVGGKRARMIVLDESSAMKEADES